MQNPPQFQSWANMISPFIVKMRNYSIPLEFMARDSVVGKPDLAASLALVNNSGLPDKEAVADIEGFLKAYVIDFHSTDPDVPRELPSLYEIQENGRKQLCIYSPRDGKTKEVTENEDAPAELRESFRSIGKSGGYTRFASDQTDYAVHS